MNERGKRITSVCVAAAIFISATLGACEDSTTAAPSPYASGANLFDSTNTNFNVLKSDIQIGRVFTFMGTQWRVVALSDTNSDGVNDRATFWMENSYANASFDDVNRKLPVASTYTAAEMTNAMVRAGYTKNLVGQSYYYLVNGNAGAASIRAKVAEKATSLSTTYGAIYNKLVATPTAETSSVVEYYNAQGVDEICLQANAGDYVRPTFSAYLGVYNNLTADDKLWLPSYEDVRSWGANAFGYVPELENKLIEYNNTTGAAGYSWLRDVYSNRNSGRIKAINKTTGKIAAVEAHNTSIGIRPALTMDISEATIE